MTYRVVLAGTVLASVLVACGRHPADSPPAPAAEHVLYYVDPMHPAYKSDKPGKAPDCGMDLEPVYSESATTIAISQERQQQFGIRAETVERKAQARVVHATGRVEADADRLWRVMSGASGWVESVDNNPPGTLVRKERPLATLFSRDFRNAQQAYVGSLANIERTQRK